MLITESKTGMTRKGMSVNKAKKNRVATKIASYFFLSVISLTMLPMHSLLAITDIEYEIILTPLPGLFKTVYKEEIAYTDVNEQYILTGKMFDMGGRNPGLGDDLPIETVKKNVGFLLFGRHPDEVRRTPLKGVYELIYDSRVVYVDGTGRFTFKGGELIGSHGENLTDKARQRAKIVAAGKNLDVLSKIKDDEMLIFPASTEKHKVTLFVDVGSPDSLRIYNDRDAYDKNGITARYVFFPRAGKHSKSYYTSINVWCSKSPYTALDKVYTGQSLPILRCKNPIDKHLSVSKELGLKVAPVIVLEDGTLMRGYHSPKIILEQIRKHNQPNLNVPIKQRDK